MLKQVCNVEVVIDGITTSAKGQLRKKSRKCTQSKRIKIFKWKNQYELKQREIETIKRMKERIMKEKEEIKRQ